MPRPDAPAPRPRAKRQKARKPDAAATRENILAVAREEFAEHGLAGARV
ncbi:MAG: TetR/AcrR family transcriptional regulator, partial [Alphaproteobacteria bacterium]|nr:TetR/AcrR family transcriptional regulator [Alphaproteobacteria bacterium]